MPLSTPENLAARRTFAPEDVFFSTTDRKGGIRHANETFLRLAALSEDEAVGSPHNLIRHPDMPGGAFRLVWDELEAGRPVAAYIANEAKDGARYDVLAGILPIDGGYLSIRLRPGLTDVEAKVHAAYDAVAAREQLMRSRGSSRHGAAERGAAMLGKALAQIGYGSMASFTRSVLPREVEALIAALPPAVAPGPEAGALGPVLAASQEVGRSAAAFASHLDGFEDTAQRVALEHDTLTPVVGELMGVQEDLGRIAEVLAQALAAAEADSSEGSSSEASSTEANELAGLLEATRATDAACADAADGLESLPLERLRTAIRDLTLRISMVVLLNQTITRFTSEVIAAGPDGAPRGTELRLLHGALDQQLDLTEAGTARVAELLRVVPELTEVAVRAVDVVALRGESWAKRLVAAAESGLLGEDGPEVAALTVAASAALSENHTGMGDIIGLSARLKQTPVRFDPSALRVQVRLIGDGVAGLA